MSVLYVYLMRDGKEIKPLVYKLLFRFMYPLKVIGASEKCKINLRDFIKFCDRHQHMLFVLYIYGSSSLQYAKLYTEVFQ